MDILRYESNDIEFFTVQATGESGISHRGLAILCGVTHTAINKLVNNLETKQAPKRLKTFADKDLHLETKHHKQGGQVKILRADFCAATIKHYALEGREIAEHSMDKFMTLGINTWIQSITGWQIEANSIPVSATTTKPSYVNSLPDIDQENLLEQIDLLHHNLMVALKHRHAIHNIVEKPTVVDLSLNQIVHTAVHVQAQKLNQALVSLQSIRNHISAFHAFEQQLNQKDNLWQSVEHLSQALEKLRQENTDLKLVIQQQKLLVAPRRKVEHQSSSTFNMGLETSITSRIKEITSILMQSQKRTGGQRAINSCTKKAKIYALYEIGQSLNEISRSLQMPYETVKTYVKLTRDDIRSHYSEEN